MFGLAETVIMAERDHIAPRENRGETPWRGIGLSGGGIRAASLALGVLQSLAEHDLLKHFHYISSVSGGGYLASSLQWWWSKGRPSEAPVVPRSSAADGQFGVGPDDFPYGPARPDPGNVAASPLINRAVTNLSFLRAHSNYLTPGQGLNVWSMIGVLLRTIVISTLTWLPLLTAVMAILLFVVDPAFEWIADRLGLWSPVFGFMDVAWQHQTMPTIEYKYRYPALFAVFLYIFYASSIAFVCAAIIFALISRSPRDTIPEKRSLVWPVVSVAVVLALSATFAATFRFLDISLLFVLTVATVFALVASITVIADRMTDPELDPSYLLRRKVETVIGGLFLPSLICLAIGLIPVFPAWARNAAPATTAAGVAGLAAGVVSALYGYYTFLRNLAPSLAGQVAATAGSILYIYVTAIIAYIFALVFRYPMDFASGVYATEIGVAFLLGIACSIFAAGFIAFRGNINFVGLHRFYRDRLMETFMPTEASVETMSVRFSPIADNLSIGSLCALSGQGVPYPIINANVILANDPHRKYSSRGGDNFIMSPLFVGSTATGWQETSGYVAKNGPLTLPSAMAASGAAASASAGYIGTGITCNPVVSAVMSLLNIRLGLWISNPFRNERRRFKRIPTFWNPGLVSGIFQKAHTHDSKFIELTDGGHFENLALYELVRRRLKVILIVDGEADPKLSLASLVSATRRIEEDFGARLEFNEGMGPEGLMMYPPERGYPAGVRYAEAAFMVGKLTYRHETEKEGVLVYIKSTLIKEMDFTTAGYLASNPEFPHQSTVDQFFDPAQFDAYRMLGYECAEAAISALKMKQSIGSHRDIDDAFLKTPGAGGLPT